MWGPGTDPGTEKEFQQKTDEIRMKSVVQYCLKNTCKEFDQNGLNECYHLKMIYLFFKK